MSWLLGFFISAAVWMGLNTIWPPPGVGEVDEKDIFGTFGPREIEETGANSDNVPKLHKYGLEKLDSQD